GETLPVPGGACLFYGRSRIRSSASFRARCATGSEVMTATPNIGGAADSLVGFASSLAADAPPVRRVEGDRVQMSSRRVLASCVAGLVVAISLAAAEKPDPHLEAGRELYRMIGGERMMNQMLDAMLAAADSDKQMAPYRDVMKEWFAKTIAAGHL